MIVPPHSLSSCSPFRCDFWVIALFFIQISFGLALGPDHTVHWNLWDFFSILRDFGRFEIWLLVSLSETCLFCSLNIVSQFVPFVFSLFSVSSYQTLKIKKKKNLSFAFGWLVQIEIFSILLVISDLNEKFSISLVALEISLFVFQSFCLCRNSQLFCS